jgi:hypothetical protein
MGRTRAAVEEQLETSLRLGLPALAGLVDADLEEQVARLVRELERRGAPAGEPGRIPALLVLPGLDAERVMPLTLQGTRSGYVDMRPVAPASFTALPELAIPRTPYLAIDVDTGRDTLGVAPRVAAAHLAESGRSPLTLEEGVTLLALNPGILREQSCFQMLGSRRGDKRIASLWVTKAGRPRLGWCYEGVPHTWLGAASCSGRLA